MSKFLDEIEKELQEEARETYKNLKTTLMKIIANPKYPKANRELAKEALATTKELERKELHNESDFNLAEYMGHDHDDLSKLVIDTLL